MRRRLPLGIALVLACGSLALLGAAAPVHADASFTSHADAQTFHVTISNDKGSIPTLPDIDAGIGSAQVTFSSFGGGVARAASPDAGSAASLPALLGAVVPTLIPHPLPFTLPSIAVPGDITVQSGEKPAKTGTGPYELDAAVTDSSASSKAVLGGSIDDDNGVLKTQSLATVTVGDDDSVTATATSVVDGLRINGLVSLGEIKSEAVVTRDSDGTLHRDASTEIGLLDIAGVSLSFQGDQFVTPVGKLPVSLSKVTKLLSNATRGLIDIEITPAHNTPDGIIAGSVRIVQTVPPPPQCVAIPLPTPIISGVTYCGTTTVVYDLGKASASTVYSLIPDTSSGGGDGAVVPPGTGSVPPVGPSLSGDFPLGTSPAAAVPAPEASQPVLTPAAQIPLLSVRARFVDMSNLYLALVGFAVLLLLSSTCLRLLGVRNKWTS